MLEERELLLSIINRDFNDKIKVYIGEEIGCPEMDGCSLVVSSYKIKDKPSGRLAVLGPKRMKYKYTIPAVEHFSDILSELLEGI